MSKTRRNHSPQFKAKVAVEALQGEKTVHEIAAKYQVHPTQVNPVAPPVDRAGGRGFSGKPAVAGDGAPDRETLLAKIGSLTVERDFLSRALGK